MKTTKGKITDFDSIVLKLASPERVKEWSYGEVTKPETINYRTQRSERGGLFDERIFGPEKDYECYCGKYKRIRYKGIICEKCGVEVTRSIVRRERMGHIELASPVAHIWFLRGVPSRIGLLLNLSVADIEKVVYFAGYIITNVNDTEKTNILKRLDSEYKEKVKGVNDERSKGKLKELLLTAKKEVGEIEEGNVIDEATYGKYSLKYGTAFEAGIGAEAIYNIFRELDLHRYKEILEERLEKAKTAEKTKLRKRLGLIKSLIISGVMPEWMFLTMIPVTPPALRPMVALEGGRHATSDVNDLYRRVINRNNRLKKLKEIGAPEVILRNEKRILQEAVDSLIDNSIRRIQTAAVSQSQKRALKSIADTLKGKQGLFRQNLLGKRVDYSGRSVIVVGPDLKLNQCGLPKHMALELFRPFVISKILERELAFNIRGAGRIIDDGHPDVWAILEEVIKNKFVLLNRAPTLHRLGIQAFNPILIEGNAIMVHPLVCRAFNADFDGDQMAVHVPLSDEAQQEARDLMASNQNLLGPGNGDPIVNPELDIVLGCYWMTKVIDGEVGEGKVFPNPNSAIMAYDFGLVGFRSKIKVMPTDSPKYGAYESKLFETSVGRLLFNSVLPSDFAYINKEVNKRGLGEIVEDIIERYGMEGTPKILDKIKAFGYKYVTQSGITWGIDEVQVPAEKKGIIEGARKKIAVIQDQYDEGLLANEERFRKVISVWQETRDLIERVIPGTLAKDGPVSDMLHSGARGSISQIVQMAGMKGLIVNTAGRTIDFPIIPSAKEGLSPIEYFVTTHGSRKGLADTALKTAKAGYLTRRLVDVAQDAIITEEDCGEKEGKRVTKQNLAGFETPISKNLRGRILAKDVVGVDGKVLFKKGAIVSKKDAIKAEEAGVTEAFVRSPLTCKTLYGVCQKCYGVDPGRNKLVKLGEAVGIVAAQAIGEPGTQLTMRTFHAGGIASVGGDITQGLPRVEEIFERKIPKSAAVINVSDGEVIEVENSMDGKKIIVLADPATKTKGKERVEYIVPLKRMSRVKVGDTVKKGDILTDGSADISELFKYSTKDATQDYILNEVNRIYELQGASICKKHIEVIVRQMFARVRIKEAGDTKFIIGSVVDKSVFNAENEKVKAGGGEVATAISIVLGISDVALTTKSWLSAASFENTTRVLIETAIRGTEDQLRGLKENVILGRLIPVGTGARIKEKVASDREKDSAPVE
ncbi:MAG: DNA-directed RNA polymerase subunit beta' [Candidatus Yonathbacteria bacterium CG_4_10_14_3_um_filter_47_65]|uniref:DNA-directed RNA polymerase subunit beta' n=2 Tax=Parcubacteria group TaxID=1794811 RepID=A0A2M8D6F2_9BACT|nr:MAG: DNA-directed RNA polymerase subunit beta' [Candidatus Nomurabacteria bacterium CG1_02_47_685]PIP04033.1 MAG: DNA-directed RNA polymerase subunit beta' [Candidatus Yonathbacteria bacterium CG23_combo_of_CG06-09_8_20_14_all_46_18]PIQ32218.1 MAG: DNA-directed RNA polymerase subunit beta' [Candidatus Yonathbacteria bacterium CG17_big_fil_post_rev_8_21_14_2_50_46_19]PIX56681.1 MAG: DNA-directed RNA polymerase subunit beta' [Candidatus Yonathbacteria bacterium CG_4_10_14_3_um_filter_47_65]PIY